MNDLLQDLKRVEEQENQLDRFSYDIHGKYSIEDIEQEFGSWTKAKETVSGAGELDKNSNTRGKGLSDEKILSDMRKAARIGSLPFNKKKYAENGKYSYETVSRNIESWERAKEKADIKEIEKDKAIEKAKKLKKKLKFEENISNELEEFIDCIDRSLDDKLILGAFYCSLREKDIAFTMKDIACEVTEIDKQDIYEAYRYILANNGTKQLSTISTESFAERYWSSLELPDKHKNIIRQKAKNIEPNSSPPHVIAAGIVYLLGKKERESLTQRDVAKTANISQATVRKSKKRLKEQIKD